MSARDLAGVIQSYGCSNPKASSETGTLLKKSLTWAEDGLPTLKREFHLDVPSSYKPGQPTPLVLVFHGWGGSGVWYHDVGFGALAEKHGFIAVYPQGVADCQDGAQCQGYTSWNAVGSSGSTTTRLACNVDRVNLNYCYKSCVTRKGKCHQCDWTTCYDDVGFTAKLLDYLEAEYCIDRRMVFAYGCSNGGMFVHQLAQSLPSRFSAIAAECGGKPHRGWEQGLPAQGPPMAMLLITGHQDHTIPKSTPSANTKWWDGYLYASESTVVNSYKEYNRCTNPAPQRYAQPFSANNMVCMQAGFGCLGNTSVVECNFSGSHDLNLGKGTDSIQDGPELCWHFFVSHPREERWLSVPTTFENVSWSDGGASQDPGTLPWLLLVAGFCLTALFCLLAFVVYKRISVRYATLEEEATPHSNAAGWSPTSARPNILGQKSSSPVEGKI